MVAHNLENPQRLRASRHQAVPSAIFSYPEMAQVGLTEAQASERIGGENITTKVQNYGDTAYGWAMEDEGHCVKLLGDPQTRTLLGAHIIGPQASTLIQTCIQGMSVGQTVDEMARGQYWIHPALSEVVESALLGLGKEMDTTR